MIDFNERVVPGLSANFLYQEALARYEFALRFLKPDFKVLDLGCGTGYGTALLSQHSSAVTGVDRDSETIAYAARRYRHHRNLIFKKFDVFSLPHHFGTFDVITCFELIEHLSDLSRFLKTVQKFLSPKGILILSTPNKSVVSPDGLSNSQYHVNEFTLPQLKKLLLPGFSQIKFFGQQKSSQALDYFESFLASQKVRQNLVDKDKLNLRKLLPRTTKEKIWKQFGGFFGRRAQEQLTTADFPFSQTDVPKSYYLLAVCQK